MLSFFWVFIRKLKTRVRDGYQAGLYKHLKTMDLEGGLDCNSAYMDDEDGILVKDVKLIHERWIGWFHTLSNAKSPTLGLNFTESLDQWPENTLLEICPGCRS